MRIHECARACEECARASHDVQEHMRMCEGVHGCVNACKAMQGRVMVCRTYQAMQGHSRAEQARPCEGMQVHVRT